MVKRLGYFVLLVAMLGLLGWASLLIGCVDVTNAGRDVRPPDDQVELLPSGASCSADNQCASGDCVLDGADAGRCR